MAMDTLSKEMLLGIDTISFLGKYFLFRCYKDKVFCGWCVVSVYNCICLGLNIVDLLEDVFHLCMNVATQPQLYLTRHMQYL